MAEMSPELRAALDTAKERIKVDSYFVTAMNKGTKGTGQSYWAGMTLGGLAGLLAGAMVGLITLAAGVTLPISLPMLMLGTLALGTVAGSTMSGRIGAAAGATSGVMAEFERRMKADQLEQEVLKSPEKQREIVEAYRRDPVVERDNTVGEALKTTKDGKGWRKVIDFKTMALTMTLATLGGIAIFAGGAVFGGGAFLTALGLNAATSIGSAIVIGGGVGATIGMMFGVTMPMLFASFTKFSSDMLSQKLVRGKSSFEPVKTVEQMHQEAAAVRGTFRPYVPDAPVNQVQQAAEVSRVEAPQQIQLH